MKIPFATQANVEQHARSAEPRGARGTTGLLSGGKRSVRKLRRAQDPAGRNWPNKTSRPRSSAPAGAQTDCVTGAPGVGVCDPRRHHGRSTCPASEIAGAPIGAHSHAAQALAPIPVRALHLQTMFDKCKVVFQWVRTNEQSFPAAAAKDHGSQHQTARCCAWCWVHLDQFLSNIKGPTPQHVQHRFLVKGQR
jgi:hypothetical protein